MSRFQGFSPELVEGYAPEDLALLETLVRPLMGAGSMVTVAELLDEISAARERAYALGQRQAGGSAELAALEAYARHRREWWAGQARELSGALSPADHARAGEAEVFRRWAETRLRTRESPQSPPLDGVRS